MPGPEDSLRAGEQGAPQKEACRPAGTDRALGAGGAQQASDSSVRHPLWGTALLSPSSGAQRDVAPATEASSLGASQIMAD